MLELNKIYNTDCLVGMQQIPDKSIDMILCDLPYGTTQCKWDVIIPFDQLWTQYNRIIKDNGAILLFGTEPFSSHLRLSNIKIYKYDWVWDKVKGTGFLNANRQPMRNHEFVHVFYKKQPTYNPQKTSGHKLKQTIRKDDQQTDVYGLMGGNQYSSKERYPRSIQAFSTDTQKSNIHPTQKPVAWCEYLIKTYTNEGEVVFDGCSGSGTTAVAAINTNRKFLCMEKEKEYFDKSVERIMKAGDS